MPELNITSQADFPAALRWQAIGFMRTEWPFIFRGRLEYMTETYDPEHDPVHFCVTEGESLLSYAAIMRVAIEQADARWSAYGLRNVFTFPPYRGRGHGRQVVTAASEYVRGSDVDLSILFCEPAMEPFYAACGWRTASGTTYLASPGGYRPMEEARMILLVSERARQHADELLCTALYLPWHW